MKMIKMRACGGWPAVLDSVKKMTDEGKTSIGIIDRDFREYVDNYGEVPENVFVSDEHDVEMMIIKAEGIERVINNFDASDHIEQYEEREGAKVLDVVLYITNKIGVLKLIDRRERLNLKLRKRGKGTEFDLPNYENILDKMGHYVSDEKMIDYLLGWSRNNQSQPSKSREDILALYSAEDIANYDSYQLSNGHDVAYLIAHLIWKQISGEKTDKEEIEKLLRVSYTKDSLMQTRIFASITEWCEQHQMELFK